MKTKAALIGCGDYLRWMVDDLYNCQFLEVKYTFDLDRSKSELRASQLGAKVCDDIDKIYSDDEIEILLIFTPPFARKEYFEQAARTKKHIIATKPLASNIKAAKELEQLVAQAGIKCAVHYGRTGDDIVETIKGILDSGEIGQLGLYKEDWFHHYPTWNKWATSKDKNGGPFMDAMIHNLNKARFLAGSKIKNIEVVSENLAQNLNCNDTEFLKVSFDSGASSYLFITWAGNFEIYDENANEREHIAYETLITNKGWVIKVGENEEGTKIMAQNNKQTKTWDVKKANLNPFDLFVDQVKNNKPVDFDISDAVVDIEVLSNAFNLA